MRKFIMIVSIAAICAATILGIFEMDKGSKKVSGFSDSNTVFSVENGTVTIFNEEFRLK